MGYTNRQARAALKATDNNLERCFNSLKCIEGKLRILRFEHHATSSLLSSSTHSSPLLTSLHYLVLLTPVEPWIGFSHGTIWTKRLMRYLTHHCTVLYCTVLYCTVLYCTVLYCTVLYCTVLYCTVLYCTVLYCTVLYCTVLYCTVLYCTVLYYAVLCCTMLWCDTIYCLKLLFLMHIPF